MNLTLWQQIQLRLSGRVFLRMEKREGWKGHLPIYAVKCKKHGLFQDYPHGFTKYFSCPKCREEETRQLFSVIVYHTFRTYAGCYFNSL